MTDEKKAKDPRHDMPDCECGHTAIAHFWASPNTSDDKLASCCADPCGCDEYVAAPGETNGPESEQDGAEAEQTTPESEQPAMFPADPCVRCDHARGWHRTVTGELVQMGACTWPPVGDERCDCPCFVYPAVPDDVMQPEPNDRNQPAPVSKVIFAIHTTRPVERALIELVETGFHGETVELAAARILERAVMEAVRDANRTIRR